LPFRFPFKSSVFGFQKQRHWLAITALFHDQSIAFASTPNTLYITPRLVLGVIYSLSMYKKDEKTSFKQKKSIYSRQKIEITQNLLCNFVTNKKPTFLYRKN